MNYHGNSFSPNGSLSISEQSMFKGGNWGKQRYKTWFWESLIHLYIPAVVIAFIMRCVLKCCPHIIRIRSNKQRWIRWGLSACQWFRVGFQQNINAKFKIQNTQETKVGLAIRGLRSCNKDTRHWIWKGEFWGEKIIILING